MRANVIMTSDFLIKIQPRLNVYSFVDFKTRVFRRDHVGNEPVNRIDSSGLWSPVPGPLQILSMFISSSGPASVIGGVIGGYAGYALLSTPGALIGGFIGAQIGSLFDSGYSIKPDPMYFDLEMPKNNDYPQIDTNPGAKWCQGR